MISRPLLWHLGRPPPFHGHAVLRDRPRKEDGGSGTIQVEYDYNGTGRLAEARYPEPEVRNSFHGNNSDGVYEAYDRFGRTLFQRWYRYATGNTAYLDEWDYTYDYTGNRLTRDLDSATVSGAPADHDQKFTYDGLHRLKTYDEGQLSGGSITNKRQAQEWTALDQLGNWAEFKQDDDGSGWDLEQTRAHNDVNEVGTIGSTTGPNWADPQHDAAGNMTAVPYPPVPTANMWPLKYDAWNRLITVCGGPLTLTKNEYDGLGRRIRRVAQSSETYDYYYNEQWQLLEERKDGDTDPLAQYVWHPYYIDALAVRYYDADTNGSANKHYYCQDANFNVTAITDYNGDVLERYHYTPYGEVTFLEDDFDVAATEASAIGNTHLYTGRERDPETGLQLNRHRYYGSHLGRWLTRDPNGYYWSAMNLVQYAGSSPVLHVDADGLRRRRVIIHPPPSDDPFEQGLDAKAERRHRNRWEDIECVSVKDCADRTRGQPGDCISHLEVGGHGRSDGRAIIIGPKGPVNRGDLVDSTEGFEELLGHLDFCDDCFIQLTACNLGNEDFMQMVQDATDEGCEIRAPTGIIWCRTNGKCVLPRRGKGPDGGRNRWKTLPGK